jgi:hypothetical protein
VLVVDAGGETVALLERPVAAADLRDPVSRAGGGGAAAGERTFRHAQAPAYSMEVPQGYLVLAVGEAEADLRLWHEEERAEVTVRAAREGAAGPRGEPAAIDAVGRRRGQVRAEHPSVESRALGGGTAHGELWIYRVTGAEGAGEQNVAEALFVHGGDVFAIRVGARRASADALARIAREIASAIEGAGEEGSKGG